MPTIRDGRDPGDGPAQAVAPSPRWALAGLSLSTLLAALGISIAHVALPVLAHAFGVPFQRVQWVVVAYLLAITTSIVGVGRLGDLIGRRRLLLAGLGLFTAASALCGLAPSIGLLVAARVAQGLGAAVMTALAMACVGEAVPKARTGSVMGLLGTMSAIGTALGPTLGGILIAGFGWPAIFLVLVPLGLLAAALTWRFLPADRPAAMVERAAFDHAGSIVLGLTLAAYALAMTVGGRGPGLLNLALLLAAIGGAVLFAMIEGRVASPLLRLALLRHPVHGAGFAISGLTTTVVMATLVVGPFYLAGAMALAPVGIGLVMSTGPIVAALAGIPAGRLSDRIGTQRMIFAGLIAMAIGSAALPPMAARCGAIGYVASLAVITAGYAFVQAANSTAVMTTIAADQRGLASGMLSLARNLGLITGASAMGAIFAHGSAVEGAAIPGREGVMAGMQATFAAGAALIGIAIVVAVGNASRRLPVGG